MTIIIHLLNGTFEKWEGITKIEKPSHYINLYRDKEFVKQVCSFIKLEVA